MVNDFIDVSVTIFLPVMVGAGSVLIVLYVTLWLYTAWDDVVGLLRGEE